MFAVDLRSQTDIAGWRDAARRLRQGQIPPDHVDWGVGERRRLIAPEPLPAPALDAAFHVPKAFVDLVQSALFNRAPDRFDLLYRILWRLQTQPDLLHQITDPDVAQALGYRKAVQQATHKMHAFVRFRRVDDPATSDEEAYAAWFESPHYVLEPAIAYFVDRLANIRFSILTPDAAAYWDKATLTFGPGADPSQVPDVDAAEEDWKTYFASIFNPARVNPKVMTQHMAKRYWRNLPEASLIADLVQTAGARSTAMVDQAPTLPSVRSTRLRMGSGDGAPTANAPETTSLPKVAAEIQACRRCDLWRDATQAVAGVGPVKARMMLVGEQPGDAEDLRGLPFVGPAGALLNQALIKAGIDREACYVTNAVKHFKHEQRGKRRIHKTPQSAEITACRWWLQAERALVTPKVIVALGGTAAAALLQRPVSVLKERGPVERTAEGAHVFITVHPSYLLRIPEPAERERAYEQFVEDLKTARRLAPDASLDLPAGEAPAAALPPGPR